MTSAYPKSVAMLVEQVRELADQEGAMPSRNRIMTEFKVGARKANQVLAELVPSNATASAGLASNPGSVAAEPDTADRVASHHNGQVTDVTGPGPATAGMPRSWPLVLLALPAFVAIWSGWVGLGGLAGFGTIRPLPGIADSVTFNTAITLPIGVEAYAAYALNVWLGGHQLARRARRFAKYSALGALGLGALGQVAFHIMTAAGMTIAPWPITTLVSCLPVVVLGCGAALRHLVRAGESTLTP